MAQDENDRVLAFDKMTVFHIEQRALTTAHLKSEPVGTQQGGAAQSGVGQSGSTGSQDQETQQKQSEK